MADRKWTTEQLQAITERGKNILVSAGAGSGKTAVMVERATRLILEDRVPVSGMLIVTFTNAAAGEMRERLRQALKERLAECAAAGRQNAGHAAEGGSGQNAGQAAGSGSGNSQDSDGVSGREDNTRGEVSEYEWIRKQIDDLRSAQISTFHAFAQRVIREFFYLTDLEPGARVLDEAEAEVLKEEALEDLFNAEYEERQEDFIAFLDSYSGEKTDTEARDLILSIYRRLEAVPDGLGVLDEKIAELELDAEGFRKTKAYKEASDLCMRYIDDALSDAAAAEKLLRSEGLDRMADMVSEEEALIQEAAGKLPDLDRTARAVEDIPFPRMAAKKEEKEAYSLIKDSVKALRDGYKARLKETRKIWYADFSTMMKVMNMTAPFARTLARLLRRFDQIFRDLKSEQKGIDYSDMEHYAYEILGHKEAAGYYRDLFRYIFIDEYQDTNYMQETIAGMIARDDDMFMVGDIKQSIYHFRLADPEIFQNKYKEYRRMDAGGEEHSESQGGAGSGSDGKSGNGHAQRSIEIDLNMNFRSKPAVIRAINNMFRPLMEGYDESAELVCGVEQGEHALPEPKTYIVDRKAALEMEADAEDAELDDIKKEELEARQAVQIIRENLGMEFTDPKSGKSRKVDYRDIVILMRSFRRSAEGYRKVFQEAGIPLYIDDKGGYFDTIEINVALALLSVIDNKRQDVPFIALLRSEIFGFSCEELALVRKLHRHGSYVEAAEAAAGIDGNAGDGDFAGHDSSDEGAGQTAAGVGSARVTDAGRSECGPDAPDALRQKLRHVFREIKKWQTYAVTLPLSDMIWRILNETGYYITCGTFPGGAGRQANLRLLADRARDYSEHTLGSLYGFIRYIDTLKKNQVEMPQAALFSENENVVRIMTIHHSKGLEFPVVILAGMDNQPRGGRSSEADFDREIGLGLRAKDPVRHLREDSLVQRIIAAKERQAETDELKRVFYVAVTRARETFYLLGAADYEKIMAGLDAGQHSDTTLLKMSRYLPEVVYVSGAELASKPLSPENEPAAGSASQESEPAANREHENSAEVIARLDYTYPYQAAGDLAAKTSVTGINQARAKAAGSAGSPDPDGHHTNMRKSVITGLTEEGGDTGRVLDPDIPGMDEAEAWISQQGNGSISGADVIMAGRGANEQESGSSAAEAAGKSGAATDKGGRFSDIVPDFISGGKKLNAARIGTAYHKIMEKLDFSRAGREGFSYIAGRAAELVNAGILTDEEVKAVDLGKVGDFFRTDLGKRCTAAADASMLYKEQTFESKVEMEGESVLVQGVIDCWFEEGGKDEDEEAAGGRESDRENGRKAGGMVLIDYKTNRIDPGKPLDEEKARICEMYRTQLDMYADAMEKAAGKRVKEKYLYLFAVGEAVKVE